VVDSHGKFAFFPTQLLSRNAYINEHQNEAKGAFARSNSVCVFEPETHFGFKLYAEELSGSRAVLMRMLQLLNSLIVARNQQLI
jgi:hypothetical protein